MGKIVYHYCSVDTFLKIIKNKEIWLTDVTKSNDSSELHHAYNELEKELKTRIDKCKENGGNGFPFEECMELLLEYFNVNEQLVHVCCFSEENDSLSQWAMYADNATGIAIGFDTDYFNVLVTPQKNIYFDKVSYSLDSFTNTVKDFIKNTLDEYNKIEEHDDSWQLKFVNFVNNDVMKKFCFYKHSCFAQEKEYRIVFNSILYTCIVNSDGTKTINRVIENTSIPIIFDVNSNYDEALGGIDYYVSKGKMVSYRPLHINDLNNAIKEIVIGPKSAVNEHDVKVFLAANKINIPDDKIIRSGTTYQ